MSNIFFEKIFTKDEQIELLKSELIYYKVALNNAEKQLKQIREVLQYD